MRKDCWSSWDWVWWSRCLWSTSRREKSTSQKLWSLSWWLIKYNSVGSSKLFSMCCQLVFWKKKCTVSHIFCASFLSENNMSKSSKYTCIDTHTVSHAWAAALGVLCSVCGTRHMRTLCGVKGCTVYICAGWHQLRIYGKLGISSFSWLTRLGFKNNF